MIDDAEFYRWYGSWLHPTPSEIAGILEGVPVPWWIVGGWAMEAYTGSTRPHEDTDVAIMRGDLAAVLKHLLPEFCVWSNLSGTIRPLQGPEGLLEGCRQIWVRKDGMSPWLFDLLLTPHQGDVWISIRDDRIRLPLEDCVFSGDGGILYLRPEIVLHLKARLSRSKDDQDLAAALPLLDEEARRWLGEVVERENASHPWLKRIGR
ncbi:MAG TPA: hypothetical protein VNE62_03385 [Actinomycetota bacterium]|nr:hypothetical protein [Actinomycetota bacterium]